MFFGKNIFCGVHLYANVLQTAALRKLNCGESETEQIKLVSFFFFLDVPLSFFGNTCQRRQNDRGEEAELWPKHNSGQLWFEAYSNILKHLVAVNNHWSYFVSGSLFFVKSSLDLLSFGGRGGVMPRSDTECLLLIRSYWQHLCCSPSCCSSAQLEVI